MREKKHDRKNRRGRLIRSMLLIVLAFVLTAGTATVMPSAIEVSAAPKKKTKIRLEGRSGRYIIDTGYNWWLKDKNGKRVTGFQYIKVPKGKRLKSGYYMFDSKGCLCKKNSFISWIKRLQEELLREHIILEIQMDACTEKPDGK